MGINDHSRSSTQTMPVPYTACGGIIPLSGSMKIHSTTTGDSKIIYRFYKVKQQEGRSSIQQNECHACFARGNLELVEFSQGSPWFELRDSSHGWLGLGLAGEKPSSDLGRHLKENGVPRRYRSNEGGRDEKDGCMHEVFTDPGRLTVQLKRVREVQEAVSALVMPGNTTNAVATQERLDLAIKTPNQCLNELEHCMQSHLVKGNNLELTG
uniref:Uncharacterized protein n=1 Tax=Oryza brachyantha TaxID=4533 RepID=J3ME05_ORYBR